MKTNKKQGISLIVLIGIIAVALILITVLVVTLKGDKDANGTTGHLSSNSQSNDDYFVWDYADSTVIIGLTEEGLKQKELIVPEKCSAITVRFAISNALESIKFENDETKLVEWGFSGCRSLTELELPKALTEIPKGLCNGCTGLKKVIIPDTVKIIGDSSFSESALIEINIPEGVSRIDENAFAKCKQLTSIKMLNSVMSIGDKAFYSCESLTQIIFSEQLKEIGVRAFANCVQLQSIKIPNSVEKIGQSAFNECKMLSNVEFGNGLKLIEEWAFSSCNNLKTVKIPEGVKSIGKKLNVFDLKLEEIYLPQSLEEYPDLTLMGQGHSLKVYVKSGSYADANFEKYNDGSLIKMYY